MSTEIGSSGERLRGGRIPFRDAILMVVVGLLVTTCGALIGYVLHRNQQNIELLRADYLDQVAETTVREVSRVPEIAERLLRVGAPPIVVDAKVVALPAGDAGRRAIVRFTGLDWDDQARIEALARHRGGAAEGAGGRGTTEDGPPAP